MTSTPIRKSAFKTIDLVYMALSAALIAVCSWISIPSTVPFTLQTFAVFLVLALLGGKRGTLAVLVYLALGAIGLPVFSNFGAGLGFLLGNTGGYLVGFLVMGLVYWAMTRKKDPKWTVQVAAMLLGLLGCYTLGTAWFMVAYSRANGAVALGTVLGWCVFPFILPDLIKMALAILLARRLGPALKIQK